MKDEIKVGNVVVIKYFDESRVKNEYGERVFEYGEYAINGIITDVVDSSKEGRYYNINGIKIKDERIISSKVILE